MINYIIPCPYEMDIVFSGILFLLLIYIVRYNMIYSIIIVDGDSGILLLDKQMKSVEKKNKISPEVLAAFFKTINAMIDDIQVSMKKGRDISNMTRTVASEGSTIVLHYQPQARALICAIAEPDDDSDKIIETLKILGKRFWLKHRADIEIFRKESIRDIFNSFTVDIDTYTLEGKVAERFPKLLLSSMALKRVQSMGIIDDLGFNVAKRCDGKTSVLKISKELNTSMDEIKRIINKLEDVDVVKFP